MTPLDAQTGILLMAALVSDVNVSFAAAWTAGPADASVCRVASLALLPEAVEVPAAVNRSASSPKAAMVFSAYSDPFGIPGDGRAVSVVPVPP